MSSVNYNDAAYDQLLKDADTDDRVGDHLWVVTDVINDTWPSGNPRTKIVGILKTANNAKADLTISPPPPPDVVAAESKSWDKGKQKAIAQSITLHRKLYEHYKVTPAQIKVGDQFSVTTVKTKVDKETGKGGFVRVAAFINPAKMGKAAGAGDDAPPF